MNWPLIFDLLIELLYNFANSLSGYMLGAKVLGWPEPAAWLLALMLGFMGMANHWRALRKIAVFVLAVGLTGCTALYGQMSPEQLAALAKVKDAHAGCTIINSPYGRGVVVWGNADKGVLGKITIKGDTCETSIEGPAPKP